MSRPEKSDFNYDYEKYRAILNDLDAIVRDAMRFIAQNEGLDSFMGDLVFNRGEPEAARQLRNRMAALSLDDLNLITTLYNHPISLLLRENTQSDE